MKTMQMMVAGLVALLLTGPTGAAEFKWTAGAAGNASVMANWLQDGAAASRLPGSGDAIVLDGTSVQNMTWNGGATTGDGVLTNQVASWTQTGDYTGAVTVMTTFPVHDTAFTNFTVTGNMIVNGGMVTHATNALQHANNPTANTTHRLRLTVGGNLTIGENGALDAINRGFLPGSPGFNGGSSHGGRSSGNQAPYGNPFRPILPGMGNGTTGGSGNGPGGGAIHVSVSGALALDGRIDARGHYPGGGSFIRAGAGGSVLIEAATLSGDGFIHARGWSSGGGSNTGNGGGGRIAVILADGGFGAFDTTRIDARRGTGGASSVMGAAGSIYLQAVGEADGEGTYIVDFFNLAGDLVDDRWHELMAADYSQIKFILRNVGHLGVNASRSILRLTADGTSNLTVSGASTVLTMDRLIVNDEEYDVGTYTSVDLPGFIHGAGSVEVLVGPPPPSGTLFLMR